MFQRRNFSFVCECLDYKNISVPKKNQLKFSWNQKLFDQYVKSSEDNWTSASNSSQLLIIYRILKSEGFGGRIPLQLLSWAADVGFGYRSFCTHTQSNWRHKYRGMNWHSWSSSWDLGLFPLGSSLGEIRLSLEYRMWNTTQIAWGSRTHTT